MSTDLHARVDNAIARVTARRAAAEYRRCPILIYSSGGNRRFAEIARAAGYKLGSQLPKKVYLRPLYFADQDWRRPNRTAYMAGLAEHRPDLATVLDWERGEQLPEVLDWAEEAAHYAQRIIVIPKVVNGVHRIPRRIGGSDIVLGYSVPTRFGGTEVPSWDFAGWPIHLLGGSPHAQMRIWRQLSAIAEVVSVDGNYAQRQAVKARWAWSGGIATAEGGRSRWWQGGYEDHYAAFAASCDAIHAAWDRLTT